MESLFVSRIAIKKVVFGLYWKNMKYLGLRDEGNGVNYRTHSPYFIKVSSINYLRNSYRHSHEFSLSFKQKKGFYGRKFL